MRRYLAFLLLSFPAWLPAQLPAGINFTNYTRADGLPEENTNNIIQDSRGFIWIGTREGLTRFDGQQFKTWYADPADSTKFRSNNIFVVGEPTPGNILFMSGATLWLHTIYNKEFKPVSRFRNKLIQSLPRQTGSNTWCFIDQDSLFVTDGSFNVRFALSVKQYLSSSTFYQSFPLQYPFVFLYNTGANEYFLLDCSAKHISRLHIKNDNLDSRSKYFIPAAYDSSRGRLYLTAYFDGTFHIDLKGQSVLPYEPEPLAVQRDGSIRKTLLLPGNRLMQGGINGLYITNFSSTLMITTASGSDKPIASNVILDICQAKDGTYWLATTKGISRFSLENTSVRYWRKELGFESQDECKAILKGEDGDIYFLSRNKSLFKYDFASLRPVRLDSGLFYCWSATRSGEDILFTGAAKKLGVYNTRSGKISYPAFLDTFYTQNTDLVTLVFAAKNGDLWYSCNGGAGLIRNPAGTGDYFQYSRNSSPPSFSHSYVHTAAEDSHGNIWWASNKNGMLLKWEAATAKFLEYPVESLLRQHQYKTGINGLYIDKADNLWIALDGAALLKYNLNSKTGDYYDINKGLPTDAINAMCSDGKNRLWFGTGKGLCCYLPENDKVVTFTGFDGFPEDNFDGNGIFYDPDKNLLYIGARESISYFNPDTLLYRSITHRPPVFIDEMLVNGRPFYFENEKAIRLGTRENNIAFSFASPDFNRNNQLVFQYHLKGSGNEWIDLGDKRSVTFNGLPHGIYTLSVRSRYKGTEIWEETALPFTFTIKTPWHKTWGFRIALGALALLLSWYLIRSYYRRKMEKQQAIMEKEIAIEQERTKMARELHDGLGSMLSGIKHSFAAMNKEFRLTESQQLLFHANLDKLNESIKELRNISHNMASDALLKYGIDHSLRDYCSNTSSSSGIPVSYTSINTDAIKLSEEKSFHLFRVMQELLQNIIKHSEARQVIVQLSHHDHQLHLTVEDDGKGFDMESARRQKSMGLKNIETRIRLLHGSLDYQTAPGKGTSVMITVPTA